MGEIEMYVGNRTNLVPQEAVVIQRSDHFPDLYIFQLMTFSNDPRSRSRWNTPNYPSASFLAKRMPL
jgi:hypothetical protein